MKRISELEKKAKEARLEAEREIAQIREKLSFYALLDADLALFKAKLAGKASHQKDYMLVFYTDHDDCLLDYGRSTYQPKVDAEKPWSSKEWTTVRGKSGEPATIAYADDPRELFPPKISAMRMSLFGLVFVICPTHTILPRRKWDLDDFACYAHGLHPVYEADELSDSIKGYAGIDKPDLTNPDHVETIYKAREEQCKSDYVLQKLLTKRDMIEREISEYRKAERDRRSLFD